ncbi:MAG TPA: aconitate hydratase [Deltaproteobacteria bacterium]|nr:MAG: aconitate hydratase [Deltaproteobacteria bacterium GWA2_55_82]OGQ63989.1 MAG: aconitate hydratase [Deltaproteobacteria bacterium RIFCSPLOWO2_02_FULL_55_12]OIJ73422.1 MAG: aconitate hydratase [Deltaproteobacteria bacterium GWC2_55_46]HBG47285.1 aconitate hydratase [Deltaproteobacteria bacterium]HCY10051.1 aconitate hydratase [Deltaproteobacteria bacterium]
MGKSVAHKLIDSHLVSGEPVQGKEVNIRIDQTITQDATGTMAYLQFEAMGVPRVKTEISVSYVDHNTLQYGGFENADDHRFLQTLASKYGIYFSKPGNGICHQVHLERFGKPGKTMLGSDSHTPTGGGIGMLAIGAGGLDVAVALGGGPFNLVYPKVVLVNLKGKLKPWVSAKDVILELLRKMTVKGGVGKVIEYGGEGVASLTVPERATITNMGAELGATTSVFPSDDVTKAFLEAQGRESDWIELKADEDAKYDETIEINLSKLEPMIAKPHMPDQVCKVSEIEGLKVDQVCVGSCTNSSYRDLMLVSEVFHKGGFKVHPDVSMTISPGSKQVLDMMALNKGLSHLIESGARILEATCGPCIGNGQSPPSGGVSLRTFNRNFEGRSGTKDGKVYLCSPEVAVAAAIYGVITDPRKLGKFPKVKMPAKFLIDDSMVVAPAKDPSKVNISRGPNIKELPKQSPLPDVLKGKVLIKLGDNITTDHITPAGTWLKYRSNVPKYSESVFSQIDAQFHEKAKAAGGGFVVGGENYGQGSSREHAALCPMYLGIKAIVAKSFARIHKDNLVNFGILPLTFATPADYDSIEDGDELEMPGLRQGLTSGDTVIMRNVSKGTDVKLKHGYSPRQVETILAGGTLNYTTAAK